MLIRTTWHIPLIQSSRWHLLFILYLTPSVQLPHLCLSLLRSRHLRGGDRLHQVPVREQEQVQQERGVLPRNLRYRHQQHPVCLWCCHWCHHSKQPARLRPVKMMLFKCQPMEEECLHVWNSPLCGVSVMPLYGSQSDVGFGLCSGCHQAFFVDAPLVQL